MAGGAALLVCQIATPESAVLLRVVGAWIFFILGPGLFIVGALVPRATVAERLLAASGAGLVASAVTAHVVSLAVPGAYPWVVAVMTGVGTSLLAHAPREDRRERNHRAIAAVIVLLVALAIGVVAYAHRLTTSSDGSIVVNGDYDSYDTSYYAAMSAELARQALPPASPFYAGHTLTYSYYPQLVLALVSRYGGVSLVELYFRYAWPIFIAMAGLATLLCVSRLASARVGVIAALLVLLGSDLSYLFALFFRHAPDWDDLLWSNNLLTPGAEMLMFNPWAPALCVLFTGIWSFARAGDSLGDEAGDGGLRERMLTALCFGTLVQFKPFAFAAVVAGLAALFLQESGDARRARSVAAVAAGALVVSSPYLMWIWRHYRDSQSVLAPGFGYASVLNVHVPSQLGIADKLSNVSAALGGSVGPIVVPVVAGAVFTGAGLGVRLLGLPGLFRTLRGDGGEAWRLLAWITVAGAASPLVIVTRPYHQTFQVFHLSLYVLWLFVAREVVASAGRLRPRQFATVALVLVCAMPSTVHYLQVKWRDRAYPFLRVGADERKVVERLRTENPSTTVLLTHYPDRPSMIQIMAARRSVLAWARYARDTAPLQAEIDWFFRSSGAPPEDARWFLTQSGATHVLETVGVDRINPAVLAELTPVVQTDSLRLYEVPPALRGQRRDAGVIAAAVP